MGHTSDVCSMGVLTEGAGVSVSGSVGVVGDGLFTIGCRVKVARDSLDAVGGSVMDAVEGLMVDTMVIV